ncbi:heavy metal transporter [Sulfurimonas aquatica]|uniref:Heavy metal transporter n=1 Tax=Sulfurimonas aquatica TaxID=2672570 RepID=A0A975B077_9BACT|nr:cation transporter [Sulfurimonas aquatica]QSZ41831.1 heavy metal transporter [Sulfurimonas aquatica]
MKQNFEVLNVKCGGCANTLKSSLKENFGEVEVNLEVEPRIITLDVSEDKIPELRVSLKKLGYPMSDEDLTKFEDISTTAKSFVSCAIGKINQE